MMPSGPTEVGIKIATSEQQENLKNARKKLKVLQQSATDKENLSGRPPTKTGKDALISKVLQHEMTSEKIDLKRKKVTDKSIQAGSDTKIVEDDLTSISGPSDHYWEILAERRRIALEETLGENRQLHGKIEALEEENKRQKEMLEETRSLVEVLTEMINETEPADASIAEEATEES